MRHMRLSRLTTAVGVGAASLLFSGGLFLSTASPASANVKLPPITLSCSTLSGSIDLSVPAASGTLGHCQIVPIPLFFNGAISISPIDLGGGPSSGTIVWGTIFGHTLQTGISVTAAVGLGDCSAVNPADLPATLTLTTTSGLGKGLSGTGVICVDLGTFTFVNAGPVVISGVPTL